MHAAHRPWIALAFAAALLAGCATTARTTLETSWRDPTLTAAKPVKKVLIVTVSPDEFAQEAFQTEMAAELKARGVNAVPSRAYFTRYTDAERARFKRVVEGSDADAILLARTVGVSRTDGTSAGMMIGPNGAPYAAVGDIYGAYARTFDPAHYVPPSDYTRTTARAEAALYDKASGKLLWTARTRIDNADQGELGPAVRQFCGVLMDAAEKDGVIRR